MEQEHTNDYNRLLREIERCKTPKNKIFYLRIESPTSNDLIENIPDSFWSLTHLEELRITGIYKHVKPPLDGKAKTELSSKIGQLKKLRVLDLSGTGINSLPKQIEKLKNLHSLYLSSNRFVALPDSIPKLINLKRLHLAFNYLTGLPSSFSDLTALEELHLDWNNFTEFPEALYGMESILYLQLNDNKIEALPAQIKTLKNLRRLDLNTNHLRSLPREIGQLSKLESLLLSYNKLQSLPLETADLEPKLRLLEINGNPFTGMKHITEMGIGRLFQYLKQLRMNTKPAVFIGSSTEGEPYGNAIVNHLQEKTAPQHWRGVFELAGSVMSSLMQALDEFEYAVFVLTPDDKIRSRKKEFTTARDNLFFEMGLFISRIEMKRVFFVLPESINNFKLPSDIKNITHGTYEDKRVDKDYAAATLTFSRQVLERIEKDQKRQPEPYSIKQSVLVGKWEANYNGRTERFTIDNQGRYILENKKNAHCVIAVIRETDQYVEFARIPVQGGGDLNKIRFEKIDPNNLRGIESNKTETTYTRLYT